ncbi:hypothetical protein MWS90_003440, partial [Citrobacter sedlakii]
IKSPELTIRAFSLPAVPLLPNSQKSSALYALFPTAPERHNPLSLQTYRVNEEFYGYPGIWFRYFSS